MTTLKAEKNKKASGHASNNQSSQLGHISGIGLSAFCGLFFRGCLEYVKSSKHEDYSQEVPSAQDTHLFRIDNHDHLHL